MSTRTRTLAVALCLALVAAAGCGGGPTAPSTAGGTTIAGTVNVNGGGAGPGSAATALTVTVVGTNLSAVVEASGFFQLTGVPSGTVRLQFQDAAVNATAELSNVGGESLIEIQVQLTDGTAVIVNEVRTNDKVSLCHRSADVGYHLISVSTSSEPAHRSHGDGKVGEQVPAEPTQVFGENCQTVGPSVRVEKSTNGEDADRAPGPKVPVGSQVTWQYVVTNTGTVDLINVAVVDDEEGPVACPATTLAVGASMTCTKTGVATDGQYSNVATVTATSATGAVNVTDTDSSHYFGEDEDEDGDEPKVTLCHKTGNGSYHPITVSVSAEPAHRAHGDAKVGEAVPGQAGKVFGPGCSVN